MKKRMWIWCLGITVTLVLASVVPAAIALDYPKKPVALVIPYPAGGRTDMTGRIFIQVLSKYLNGTAVIENKPGAGTVLGTREVITAKPDGHTLGMFSNGLIASHYVLPDIPKMWTQLEPVAMFNLESTIMVSSAKSGIESLKQLIDVAQKNPKKITCGVNQGTATSLYTRLFMKTAGIEVTYVPFKGGGKAKVALAGGHIDLHFGGTLTYKSLVEAGKVNFLGIAAKGPDKFFPKIPTFKEQGVDLQWGAFAGIFAPKKTPPEVIRFIESAIGKTCEDKEFQAMMEKNQLSVVFMNRQEFTRYLEGEDSVYEKISKEM